MLLPFAHTIMHTLFRILTVGACLAALLVTGIPASAQPMHSLSIQDGQVRIDGQLVPPGEMPASLDVDGIQATLSFSGDVFAVNGFRYRIEEGRLREIGPSDDGADGFAFYVRSDADAPEQVSYFQVMEDHARSLQEHQQEIEQLSRETEQPEIDRLRAQARQAAYTAQVLPRIEVQSYLSEVQRYNQSLYDLLVLEWRMEAETRALAGEIRNLPTGPERRQRFDLLRQKLDTMFELKQENRRREIQRLEQELEALQVHLQKREAFRQRIIDQRLYDLVGEQSPEE